MNSKFDLAIERWMIARNCPCDEDQLAFLCDMALCWRRDDNDYESVRHYLNTGFISSRLYHDAEWEWQQRGEPVGWEPNEKEWLQCNQDQAAT